MQPEEQLSATDKMDRTTLPTVMDQVRGQVGDDVRIQIASGDVVRKQNHAIRVKTAGLGPRLRGSGEGNWDWIRWRCK